MLKSVIRKLFFVILLVAGLYAILCVVVYYNQEKLIFLPQKLKADYQYDFPGDVEEIEVRTQDSITLNALLFKVKNPRGIIFYLHGNAGSLRNWGNVADIYNQLGFDIFLLDYRGYGKSEGEINNERQMYSDIQLAYEQVKNRYNEQRIVVLGYSIGTGPAAKLASDSNPGLLILQAPYYSLIDMMDHRFPFLPKVLLKYKFETNKYIAKCKMPVVVFHGTDDRVIPYESSLRLKEIFKPSDTLITLTGEGHNGMTDGAQYLDALGKVLVDFK